MARTRRGEGHGQEVGTLRQESLREGLLRRSQKETTSQTRSASFDRRTLAGAAPVFTLFVEFALQRTAQHKGQRNERTIYQYPSSQIKLIQIRRDCRVHLVGDPLLFFSLSRGLGFKFRDPCRIK